MTLEGDGKDFAKESPNRDNGVDEDGEDDGLEEDFDEEGNINLGAEYMHLDSTIDNLDACLTELDRRNDELMEKMRQHLAEMRAEREAAEVAAGTSDLSNAANGDEPNEKATGNGGKY